MTATLVAAGDSSDGEALEGSNGRAVSSESAKNKCEHGRHKYSCKQCGGSSICEHGRVKYVCKACGGKGVCQHGLIRTNCKQCGSNFCMHGRTRSRCKDCGGSGICQHGRRRSHCKQCVVLGGNKIASSFCEHLRQRSRCKQCSGAGICQHNLERYTCKECGGAGICQHNRVRSYCKKCSENGAGSICEHRRERRKCKDCQKLCKHRRVKIYCTQCFPFQDKRCEHLIIRKRCKICNPEAILDNGIRHLASHSAQTKERQGCERGGQEGGREASTLAQGAAPSSVVDEPPATLRRSAKSTAGGALHDVRQAGHRRKRQVYAVDQVTRTSQPCDSGALSPKPEMSSSGIAPSGVPLETGGSRMKHPQHIYSDALTEAKGPIAKRRKITKTLSTAEAAQRFESVAAAAMALG